MQFDIYLRSRFIFFVLLDWDLYIFAIDMIHLYN